MYEFVVDLCVCEGIFMFCCFIDVIFLLHACSYMMYRSCDKFILMYLFYTLTIYFILLYRKDFK